MMLLMLLVLPGFCFSASNNYYTGTDIINPTPSVLSVGGSYTETTTGSTVIRRTDVTNLTPDLPTDSMIVYSRFTPVNTSGEYALVHGTDSTSCWVLRLSDNTIIHKINPGSNVAAANDEIGEVHEIRWDYTGNYPNRVYFVNGMKFYYMDVIDGNDTSTLIHDFSNDYPTGYKIINDVEGDSSNDSRYWAWQVLGPYADGTNPRLAFITYDKQTDTILGRYEPSDNDNYTSALPKPNMVEISPDGDRVLLHYGNASDRSFALDGTWVSDGGGIWHLDSYKSYTAGNSVFSYIRDDGVDLDRVGTSISDITAPNQYAVHSASQTFWVRLSDDSDPNNSVMTGNWGSRPDDADTVLDGPHVFDLDFTNPIKVSIAETHSGWGYSLDGKELFISQDNTRDYLQACYADGTGGTYPDNCFDFLNHTTFNYVGVHFGKFYDNSKRGWVAIGTYRTSNDTYGANQLLMAELKPLAQNPRIWRISPNYNDYKGGYRDEAAAAMSYDGNSIWWTANWGDSVNGHGEVYSVDLPSDWITKVNNKLISPSNLRIQ